VDGASYLPIMGRNGSPAAQARRMGRVEAGEAMTGRGVQLATGGAITNPALGSYHWNILHCQQFSSWHLLRLVQFALYTWVRQYK
jgi:hypothetical protein